MADRIGGTGFGEGLAARRKALEEIAEKGITPENAEKMEKAQEKIQKSNADKNPISAIFDLIRTFFRGGADR